jgi:ribosome biogenesis GTPase
MIYIHHQPWGWNDFFESFFEEHLKNNPQDLAARVIREERGFYHVLVPENEHAYLAQVSSKIMKSASGREDFPAVGDWVTVSAPTSIQDRLRISGILPRTSCLMRKAAGSGQEMQIFASNINEVFIVTSCNLDFNEKRLDRALALVHSSKARPRILLSKIDLLSNEEISKLQERIHARFPGIDCHAFSMKTGQGMSEILKLLEPALTYVVIGSSGVGKSTLLNHLIGEEKQKTQAIREDDEKGKHTTVSRSMHKTPGGALLIDTPGIRELQVFEDTESLEQNFQDLLATSSSCKFSNCQHQTEPGCKIKEALQNGSLELSRWESYQKLLSEMAFQARKADKILQSQEKKKWIKLTQNAKENKKFLKNS